MLQTLIQKRSNGVYYFRWAYPSALRKRIGKRELIRSLHTSCKSQALARAGAYYVVVEKLRSIYMSLESDNAAWKKAIKVLNEFNDKYRYEPETESESDVASTLDCDVPPTEIKKVELALEECYSSDVPRYSKALLDLAEIYKPASLIEVKRKKDEVQVLLNMHREAATNINGEFGVGQNIKNEMARMFAESIDLGSFDDDQMEAFRFDYDSRGDAQELVQSYIFHKLGNFYYLFWCHSKLSSQYLHEIEQVLFAYYSRMESLLSAGKREPELPSFLLSPKQNIQMEISSASAPAASILFSELYSQFIAHKKAEVNLSEKMQGDYDDYVKTFLCGIGDKPINSITKKQIREFLVTYERLPRRNLKAYKCRPIAELWSLPVPEKDRIATRTMTSIKKFLSGVFRFALDREYLTVSPANDLGLKFQLEKKRGHFLDSEVRKIFEVLDNDDHVRENVWQKWAVLFGAYTGARAGEVMGLRKEDIKHDEESDIHSVIVRGTKTKNALREFPIPPELLSKGFLNFIGGGSGRVFPANKGNKAITSFFPRIMEKSGVPKLNTKNLTRSFHSFRHTVVTKARAANFDEALVQQIVGHEKTAAGVTDTYTHDFTVEQLMPVVDAIRY